MIRRFRCFLFGHQFARTGTYRRGASGRLLLVYRMTELGKRTEPMLWPNSSSENDEAFGKPFISNPDLVIRLFLDARLATANRETFYGGGEEGYVDYPVLRSAKPDVCFQDHERAWG